MGHARALLALEGLDQEAAARHVSTKQLSVRETERYIKTLNQPSKDATRSKQLSPDVLRLEKDLGEKLGAAVKLDYNNQGKGRLVISYNSLDELDGILEHIQ
jgi:ParB family chromosome partitioning protein